MTQLLELCELYAVASVIRWIDPFGQGPVTYYR
jgi:hypothetical protein